MTDHETALACLRGMARHRADDYQTWISVGMICRDAGLSCAEWDEWSRSSPKWKDGECAKKWQSFNGAGQGIGTLVMMAREDGATIEAHHADRPIMREPKRADLPPPVLDQRWIEPVEIPESDKDPRGELADYIRAVFHPADVVAYVVETLERDGKHVPANAGTFDRTAAQILEPLDNGADIGFALNAKIGPGGAWIRLNPMDGKGVKDDNVTEFRHTLVESDSLPIEMQLAIYQELRLPIVALVHSGGKSLHAVVRVDAGKSKDLFRERVERLYATLEANGFKVDPANRNPSRLSRMPGVERNGKRQHLVGLAMGAKSWDEWENYIECLADQYPAFEHAGEIAVNPPPLAPELIHGVLRRGHKMLLSGPSKAGKSFGLIQLGVALSSGGSWFGHQCEKVRAVYVNLELDRPSCAHRIADVARAMGTTDLAGLDVWNLRGKACGLAALIPKLSRRMKGGNYGAVILDPLYMLLDGQDENSNGEMAVFLREMDRIAEDGAAIIFASHFSKGTQGNKAAIDRTSGAGTLGRFPDAIVCLTEGEDEAWDNRDGNPFVIEWVLREFASPPAQRCAFRWPVHVMAEDGQWAGVRIKGQSGRGFAVNPRDVESAVLAMFENGQTPVVSELAEKLGVSVNTVKKNLTGLGFKTMYGKVTRGGNNEATI